MKTVLITGATRGIGEAIARAFSSSGYNVIINYNKSEQKAKALAEELNCTYIQADVSNFEQTKKMFEQIKREHGNIDVLVNNAGIAPIQNVLQDITEQQFDSAVSVNLRGVFNCSKLAIDGMLENGGGSIINLSSIWGVIGGSCEVVYSMTKAGVIGFTKALAKELGPSNIRVNAVAPGFIKTDMTAHISEDAVNNFLLDVPMERIGSPEEVASVVLFLASESASYITGQVIGINGGMC